MDNSKKKLNESSFLSTINLSFQSQNNKEEDIPKESLKNPYITKDHVPELEIIDKNTITCDKKKYDIKDYIEMINNIQNDLLDDEDIYNYCGKCRKNKNKYFCENCQENICDKCYEDCRLKKHNFINLEEIKEEINSDILAIKVFLNNHIIPLKDVNENSIKEGSISFEEIKENNKDILLIIEIISQDYINFFHLLNIEKILFYIWKTYTIYEFEGFGKMIYEDGNYYIGQIKNNLANGKGKLLKKNGKIIYNKRFH